MEDDIANLLIWVWNSKDYLKNFLKSKGGNPQFIETFIDNDEYLPVCGDLANQLKHGLLKKSRSGKFPKLGALRYTVPQSAIGALTIGAFEVDVEISIPKEVEFYQPVFDQSGNEIGNVLDILTKAISRLETLRNQLGI